RLEVSGDSTSARWMLTDHLGSVRDVLDADGSVLDTVRYDSFGQVPAESAPEYRGRFGYTGREWDSEDSLQYSRGRYIDSATGRWISEDPMRFQAGDSNLYRYVGNNVTNASDPSGLVITWVPPPVIIAPGTKLTFRDADAQYKPGQN